ncbi:esterase-like activity of phytase family protein [Ancylobacter sp. A5.8]|uniref:esterase-like activity of phytase family protein n=1 Tax=Ancylobacter gelatini TaxID=2919920 RepID=UPI001F4E0AE3|nr:esterase-like activity of phytase family protein [Ancylobacter gelatini]MCJ8145120.1 esterase-like activity of phytase family protein [Ancylobacter gelatini]
MGNARGILTRLRRRLLAAGAGACLMAGLSAMSLPAMAQVGPIVVESQAIGRFDASGNNRLGVLEFKGGLVLSSSSQDFGGISGLSIAPDGAGFLAITDRGNWLSGTIRQSGDAPIGMTGVTLTPMLGPNGRTLASQGSGDAESLTRSPEGYVVGVERRHGIWLFPGDQPLTARGELIVPGGVFKALGANEGVEALLVPPPGSPYALIAVGEVDAGDPTSLPGFLFSPLRGGGLAGTFTIQRTDEFAATDMALADDGRVYLLERRYDMLRGVAMRIRRFALADIVPGARLAGEVLIEANRLASIDNMEAIAVHRGIAGEVILTLISDNNFSLLQRTVLLRFAVLR